MARVVFYEIFEEEEAELKELLPKNIEAQFIREPVNGQTKILPPGTIISTRTQSIFSDQWMQNLKGVLTRSVGYDHLKSLVKKEIPCGYLPEYCAPYVAEHALMMILVLLKKLKKQLSHFETFNRCGLTVGECRGRNLLVVGVGRIGSEMVKIGKGLGMHVRGVDIVQRVSSLDYVSLKEGVSWADIVVCALSLTEQTRGMVNYEALKDLKKGAIFVNISRGEISPLKDLSELLEEGILGGIGLDVYDEENKVAMMLQGGLKPETENEQLVLELKGRENAIFTPHNAFNTFDGVKQKSLRSCEALCHFIQTGTFPNPVTMDEEDQK